MTTHPPLRLRIEEQGREARNFTFHERFFVGRDPDCEVPLSHDQVSRKHIEVGFEDGAWCVRDLSSTNGTYAGESRVERIVLKGPTTLKLSKSGPLLHFEPGAVSSIPLGATAPHDVSSYANYYFHDEKSEIGGERTQWIRKAYAQVQTQHKRKYHSIIGAISLLLILALSFAMYAHLRTREQERLAEEIFYSMKSLELEIARTEDELSGSLPPELLDTFRQRRIQHLQLEQSYDGFLQQIGFQTRNLSPEEKIIFRIARVFGECEVTMPDGFVDEVKNYVKRWQSSNRLSNAIQQAVGKGYPPKIASEMLIHGLPPQFFYLALQESDFDPNVSGPVTYKGIAKGIWQFIPETAIKYGLQLGPLFDMRRPDPSDDRYDFDKATAAAARYLRFIYTTDAEASGLLVMASYNWGEDKVVNLIRTLPQNPKDRNFWQLLTKYRDKLPQETYDYVFYIVSAAVIGEDPQLFGFEFENPLAHLGTSR